MISITFLCTSFAALCSVGLTHRILAYFPLPAPSHHFFYQPFLLGLARRGHQVDYYSPYQPQVPHENLNHIPIENLWDDAMKGVSFVDHWKLPVADQISELLSAGARYGPLSCRLGPIKELLNSSVQYDLLLQESMYHFESGEVFKHKFKVPSVVLSAIDDFFQLNEFSGLQVNPSYMVGTFTKYSDRMDFFERLDNAYILARSLLVEYFHLKKMQKVIDECFIYPGWESRPSMSALMADQSLILVNNHPSVGFPFPRPPHVKEVGGAVVQKRKPLPQDLEDFISGAKYGVVYFSLGSVLSWKESESYLKDLFSNVFSKRKERILWKSSDEPWDSLSSNVRLSSWFPQQDVLAHENVKLFISHGGLQSTFETVHHAVPVIIIPSFGDQVKNSLALARHGYGVRLLLDNITESSLTWALDEVLYKPKYKDQVIKGSALLKDRIMDPIDEGVFWIEYVLRHGNVLQPSGARLDFIQRHCLDVLAFVLMVILLVLGLSKKLFSYCTSAHFSFSWFSRAHKKKME